MTKRKAAKQRSDSAVEVIKVSEIDLISAPSATMLVDMWLRDQASRETTSTYRSAVRDFESHMGQFVHLLESSRLSNVAAAAYRISLLERQPPLAPSTINVRLTALRSFIRYAKGKTIVDWSLDVQNVPSEVYRDTRGPGIEGYKLLRAAANGKPRELAMMNLMIAMGLRRKEVVSLDLVDVDMEGSTLNVRRKGSGGERTPVPFSPDIARDLSVWMKVRGAEPGPLFTSYNLAGQLTDRRLAPDSLSKIVSDLAKVAGIRAWCHGLRHTGITTALDKSGGNIRAAQQFSGHKDVNVLQRYDDNRANLAGKMVGLVSDAIAGEDEE